MKMIVVILPNPLSEKVSSVLIDAGFGVTEFASTAGFLLGGTTTLMVGVESRKLDQALDIIRNEIPPTEQEGKIQATIYVINIKMFERV